MVTIGNKRRGDKGVYVGRPTSLGNPFVMPTEAARGKVITSYEAWLTQQLRNPRSPASVELNRLTELARTGDLCLVCWCSPLPCHADVVKRIIGDRLRIDAIKAVLKTTK